MNKKALLLVLGALISGSAMAADTVNVNSAQSGAIGKTLGVGENIAARIVAEREENGPYKSTEDLTKRVKSLDAKTVEKHKDQIKL
ncbi:MAG TPA: helix-hairpin-helix domain-containing protein [Nevskiaceae bacterium]|nr:helix-hairpin-helix domain-containing protein [Nevskiaceae bacterium]